MTNAPSRKLIILRGLPGSGKSTWAAQQHAAIYSADHWFVGRDGIYRFDRRQLNYAHGHCESGVLMGMKLGLPVIIVDNTNVTNKEMQPYVDLGKRYGYEIEIRTFTGGYKSVHNVPQATIERMRARWEHPRFDGVTVL